MLKPGEGPSDKDAEQPESSRLHIGDAKALQPLAIGQCVVAEDAIAGVVGAPGAGHDEILDSHASGVLDSDAGLPPGQNGGPALAKGADDDRGIRRSGILGREEQIAGERGGGLEPHAITGLKPGAVDTVNASPGSIFSSACRIIIAVLAHEIVCGGQRQNARPQQEHGHAGKVGLVVAPSNSA